MNISQQCSEMVLVRLSTIFDNLEVEGITLEDENEIAKIRITIEIETKRLNNERL